MTDKLGQIFELPKPSNLVANVFDTVLNIDNVTAEKITEIQLAEIDTFPNHPFQVKRDEAMQNMAESIKTFGIQTPAIIRQKEGGRYELISGHRRKMACEIAGIKTLPCIIRELCREESIIAMIDAKLQRENILPSEKTKSYKMRLDAIKNGRAEQLNTSKDQIFRYIRLNELIPQLLEMVDNSVIREKGNLQIAMRPAVFWQYINKSNEGINNTKNLLHMAQRMGVIDADRFEKEIRDFRKLYMDIFDEVVLLEKVDVKAIAEIGRLVAENDKSDCESE